MEKKITKIDRFNQLKAIPQVAENADLMDFINHEIDLLQKKSGNKKSSKTSEEFLALKDKVKDALTDVPMTISDLIKSSDELTGYTTQKLVPVLKALKDEGAAERIEEKGKAYFVAA